MRFLNTEGFLKEQPRRTWGAAGPVIGRGRARAVRPAAVAGLVLLAAAAGAGVVAAHARHLVARRDGLRGRIGADATILGGVDVADVADALGLVLQGLGGLADLLLGLHAHRHQHAGDFHLDHVQQLGEQLEGLALVFLLGVLLGVAAQVDALAQVVQRGQVLAPVGVDGLQQHHALKGLNCASPTRSSLAWKAASAASSTFSSMSSSVMLSLASTMAPAAPRAATRRAASSPGRQVPLLFQAVGRHVGAHHLGHGGLAQVGDLLGQAVGSRISLRCW
jgi:hypothetical protein